MAPGPSKQKIRPIVWTESSDVSRKHSAPPSSMSAPGLFGPPPGGVLGRRKNWGGPFGGGGGGVGRGASRGGHR